VTRSCISSIAKWISTVPRIDPRLLSGCSADALSMIRMLIVLIAPRSALNFHWSKYPPIGACAWLACPNGSDPHEARPVSTRGTPMHPTAIQILTILSLN